MKYANTTLIICVLALTIACKSKPKVVEEDTTKPVPAQTIDSSSALAPTSGNNSATDNQMHEVVAIEILQAQRYTYMKVKEKNNEFWIATVKFEPKVGGTYLYQGGLLKTDFESQEHHRTFDKIVLVSNIIDAAAHPGGAMGAEMPHNHPPIETESNAKVAPVKDAIRLQDLLGNSQKYNGKTVLVQGKVVKVNYGIMNLNWVHIQDGTSIKGQKCDITITTTENISMGATIAMKGKVVLNKDFGAGYKYDIILENGSL